MDLNLLRMLDVVLRERSVQRAATVLKVTPSAVSHGLRRLRASLGDELLVRQAGALALTKRAEAIAPGLQEALRALERSVEPEAAFVPETSTREFTLVAADLAQLVLVPALVRQLATEAPGVKVRVRAPDVDAFAPLTQDAELLTGLFTSAPAGHRHQTLFKERTVLAMRKGHPLSRGKLTLARWLSARHVTISPRNTTRPTLVDQELARTGHTRHVALVVPHFLASLEVLASTDLVGLLPSRVAAMGQGRLVLAEPPVPLPGFSIGQLWHERVHRDPAHRWFREQVKRAAG